MSIRNPCRVCLKRPACLKECKSLIDYQNILEIGSGIFLSLLTLILNVIVFILIYSYIGPLYAYIIQASFLVITIVCATYKLFYDDISDIPKWLVTIMIIFSPWLFIGANVFFGIEGTGLFNYITYRYKPKFCKYLKSSTIYKIIERIKNVRITRKIWKSKNIS